MVLKMLRAIEHPNTYASGYTLDLYCKYENEEHSFQEFPHQYLGENWADVSRQARKEGWVIHRNVTATCPKCVKHLKK